MTEICPSSAPRARSVLVLWAALLVLAVSIALVSSDTTYDYLHYGGQWRFVLEGGNPWDYARGDLRRFNAYGPLHSLMAYPYALSTHLPKAIYALFATAATLGLVSRALVHPELRGRTRTALILLLILNPPLWILYVHGGFNDALVGALLAFGVFAYDRERLGLSALSLGLGILYKFTPIFIIPFLCIRRRRVEWAFVIPLAAVLVVGFGLAYRAWGANILSPILVGMNRESSSASIFNFLADKHSPLRLLGVGGVDFLSMPLLGLSLVAIFLGYVIYDLPRRQAVVLGLSSVLLFYRVNHIQFYLSLTLLLMYLVIEEYRDIKALSPGLVRSVCWFLVWLGCVVVAWKISNRAWKQELHAVIGLPTFLLHLWMNISLVAYIVRSRRARTSPTASSGPGELEVAEA